MTWKRIIKYDTNQDFVEAMSEEAQKAVDERIIAHEELQKAKEAFNKAEAELNRLLNTLVVDNDETHFRYTNDEDDDEDWYGVGYE